ncbi:histidine triad nucleotide-binding protein [Sulfuriroseicoccus oceanibius]|nr:histidine triad nucleotide-binding protein [Sulfuriroseicoccus oceanibius]
MTLFEKIIAGEIHANFVHKDDVCVAFQDIDPQAPTHILIVPRKPIPRVGEADASDQSTLGHLLLVAGQIAKEQGFENPETDGFRVVINHGKNGGEAVPHLHVHLLAGRQMQWPPG